MPFLAYMYLHIYAYIIIKDGKNKHWESKRNSPKNRIPLLPTELLELLSWRAVGSTCRYLRSYVRVHVGIWDPMYMQTLEILCTCTCIGIWDPMQILICTCILKVNRATFHNLLQLHFECVNYTLTSNCCIGLFDMVNRESYRRKDEDIYAVQAVYKPPPPLGHYAPLGLGL